MQKTTIALVSGLTGLAAGSLLSEPHAVSAREPTRATLARRPMRWIFTVFKPLHRNFRDGKSGAGVRARRTEGRQGE